jgi:SRSO17 transposase
MQHFMTNSPWAKAAVCRQVQADITTTPALQGGALLLDESADAKSGTCSAGASRQYNGRLGKVDVCQVGVFLTYVKGSWWTWVDGELFIPEKWFDAQFAAQRERAGIPSERTFRSKVELGWQMVQRAQSNGLPFDFLACDSLYGRADWFRSELAQADILYVADVPNTTQVYLERPEWGVPPTPEDHKGRAFSTPRVLSEDEPIEVKEIAKDAETVWKALQVRSTERGKLESEYTARRVWTLRDDVPTEEWLLIRRHPDGRHAYAFSNASADTSLDRLAWMESQRHFVERSIQDAKSELGWDEFQAWKFRAWEHNTAMTVLASWFITETQVSWTQQYPRDPQLASDLEVDELPTLSYANVRTMLRAAMPLPQLSERRARQLVAEHLLNRTRSRKSRMKRKLARNHSNSRDPT